MYWRIQISIPLSDPVGTAPGKTLAGEIWRGAYHISCLDVFMNGANVHGKTQHTRINYIYIYNKRCRTHPSRCQEDFSSLVGMFPAPRKFPRQNCHHCHVHETASTNRMRNRNGSRPIVTLLGWFFRVFPYFLGMKIQQKPSGKAQELGFFSDSPAAMFTRHGPSLCSSRLSFFTAAAKAVIFATKITVESGCCWSERRLKTLVVIHFNSIYIYTYIYIYGIFRILRDYHDPWIHELGIHKSTSGRIQWSQISGFWYCSFGYIQVWVLHIVGASRRQNLTLAVFTVN